MSPESWNTESVADCLIPVSVSGKATIQARDYAASGRFPIVGQGQEPIAGWTDDESAVIQAPLPLIVFGDHTRVFKLADKAFARGADGTQLLRPKAGIDPLFFFYACRAIDLPSRGYNRHFTMLKQKDLSYPIDVSEQKAVAAIMQKTEAALSQQRMSLDVLLRLKSAVASHVFTCGLRGELQKQTSIGRIPTSWSVVVIDGVATCTQYGLSVRGQSSGAYPILRMNCQIDGKVSYRNLQYVDLDTETFKAFRLRRGDLLFNRTNSIELVGRTAIVEDDREAVFASYLVRVTVDARKCLPAFLNYFMNWPATQREVKKLASRAVGQANINATKLRTVSLPLPPTTEEQAEIVAVLEAVDRKIDVHRRKLSVLEELFNALLQKLMTGEVRAAALDLGAIADGSVAELAS